MRKISALLVGWLLIFSGQAVFAQNPKLIEAAKKEGGKVVVYTTMEPFTLDAIKAAFEKRTGLQVEFWRSGITEVLTRALSEHRAGKITFDVIGMPGDHMQLMAKEGAEKFIRDLAAAKPIFVENTIPAAERVSSGETPIGISFPRFVLTYNRQGANLDYVRDYNMLGDGHYISLEAKAPRPDAGKAFIDFFLDDESMKIQADIGEFVNRRGIYPPLQDADKIKFVQMYQFGKEDFEAKKKEYQKIFLQ